MTIINSESSLNATYNNNVNSSSSLKNVDPVTGPGSCGGVTPISSPLQVVNFGIDTLHLSIQAIIPTWLVDYLKQAKKDIQLGSSSEAHVKLGQSNVFSFNLQRIGNKLYPYVLKSGDVTVCISARPAESKIPNMAVQVGSISSQAGVIELLRRLKMWFEFHSIIEVGNKVSRIDIAADVNCSIQDIDIADQDKHITRASKFAYFNTHRKLSGIQVGKGDIVLRVYDKLQEIKEKKAANKLEFFKDSWGDSEHITRVEFQLRREAIKSYLPKYSDIRVVLGSLKKMWISLSTDWFRHTSDIVDRDNKNHQRSSTSHFWEVVQGACGQIKKKIFRNKKAKHISVDDLLKQAAGIMVTIAAASSIDVSKTSRIFSYIDKKITNGVKSVVLRPSFKKDYLRRQTAASLSF